MKRFNYDYDFLNNRIDEHLKYYDLELKDFAISIGMSEKTLKRTLNNERDFYINETQAIAKVLSLSSQETEKAFFTHKAKPSKSIKGGENDD